MRKILIPLFAVVMIGFFLSPVASAHTPLCSCYEEENEDGTITITCEGGFSSGASGAGVKMLIVEKEMYKDNKEGKEFYEGKLIILKGKMNEDSEFTFKKPDASYIVIFDAGPGHVVEVDCEDITE